MSTERLAVGVIGHNIVIDCGTHEEALRLCESVRDEGVRVGDDGLAEWAAARMTAWAECVQRLVAVAPIKAVADETGLVGGHTTPEERKALRTTAGAVIASWLSRDLDALATASAPKEQP